jgi:hypothetical protein
VVILKGSLATVVEITIGFHDETLISPKEVEEVWTDPDIDLGPRQSMAATEPQEVSLQVTASAIATRVADRQAACLTHSPTQLMGLYGTRQSRRERPAQVRDRPRWRRDRNAVTKGHICR